MTRRTGVHGSVLVSSSEQTPVRLNRVVHLMRRQVLRSRVHSRSWPGPRKDAAGLGSVLEDTTVFGSICWEHHSFSQPQAGTPLRLSTVLHGTPRGQRVNKPQRAVLSVAFLACLPPKFPRQEASEPPDLSIRFMRSPHGCLSIN